MLDWRDYAIRAGKTFVQAFLAIIISVQITSVADLFSPDLLDQAFVAGLAAVISFAQNALTAAGAARIQQ